MIGTMALSPNGKWLAVRQGKQLALWDLAARREVAAWPCDGYRRALAFSPDGKYLAAGNVGTNSQRIVSLWEISTRREVAQLVHASRCGLSGLFTGRQAGHVKTICYTA